MPKLITEKAQMQCTLGSKPAQLVVTAQSFVKISGASVATEGDKMPMSNIPSFGNCKSSWLRPPCVPAPQS
ncbi:MAG: DUF4280 domain-containing protein, partial [Candidatus Azobacteroides sp.]|nr:DUF4280 domain-containing protein [Candidatus Azobacteroides sp.]